MGYDLYLKDPITKDILILDERHQMKGGTYCLGGTNEAHLAITYNYAPHFYKLLDKKKGLRVLYGMTGADSIPLLETAAAKLKDDVDNDYWAPTEGNAKRALLQLAALAKMRPDGVWDGD